MSERQQSTDSPLRGAIRCMFAGACLLMFALGSRAGAQAPASQPAPTSWADVLVVLSTKDDASIKSLVAREKPALPDDAAALMSLADDWQTATHALLPDQLHVAEQHILQLYELAIDKLSGDAKVAAQKRQRTVQIAQANRQLNDLSMWKVDAGKWTTTADGKIEGAGDSVLTFQGQLPADCTFEFMINIIDGMRPRVHVTPGDLYFGNEGFTRQFAVYGVESVRGINWNYNNDEAVKLGMKLDGKTLDFYVNGEWMAHGIRKNAPPANSLSISAGDGWSQGLARFWNFKVTANK